MKRAYKYCFLVGAILIFFFGSSFVIGGRKFSRSGRVQLTAAPQRVFDALVESDQVPQWMQVKEVSSIDGPGTTSRTLTYDDHRIIESITEFESPKKLITVCSNSSVSVQNTYELKVTQDADGKDRTELMHRVDLQYFGLMRFVGPYIRNAVQRKIRVDLDRLKQFVDGES